MENTKIAIIFNTTKSHEDLHLFGHKLKQKWQQGNVKVTIIYSKNFNDGVAKTLDACQQGYRYFVAAGGDGTVLSVINGFSDFKDIRLAILPLGTANNYAFTLGIKTLDDTLDAIINGKECLADIGRAYFHDKMGHQKSIFFNLSAGVGLLAKLYNMENGKVLPFLKKYTGVFGFILCALKLIYTYRSVAAIISVNDRTLTGQLLAIEITKSPRTGIISLLPQSKVDDNRLSAIFVEDVSIWRRSVLFLKFLFSDSYKKNSKVHYFDANTTDKQYNTNNAHIISVNTEEVFPIHINGESLGFTPARFELIHEKLTFLVP